MRLVRLVYLSTMLAGMLILALSGAVGASAQGSSDETDTPSVTVITFQADVNPITASYVERGIAAAERDGADALVIMLDTPGGRLDSMEQITQDLLNSPVPVIVYVAPRGAWAASAGVFITYAAHVAAMAPGTSIGAAHPVMSDGTAPEPAETPGTGNSDQEMIRKVTNHSVAHIRSIAAIRGRNADWGEQAIRESVSVTALEAAQMDIVDFVADDLPTVLEKADGMQVDVQGQQVTLNTAGATTNDLDMNLVESFLQLLTNSTIAYTLLSLGGLALTVEIFNPGAIFPGVAGVIMLLLGLVALGFLPVNVTAVALIVFAFVLFIADLFMTAHGILTAGGIIALLLGGLLLVDTSQAPGIPGVSIWAALGVALGVGGFFFFALYKVFEARRKRPSTGQETLVGRVVPVRADLAPKGMVFADGALWRAVSIDGDVPSGKMVEVVSMQGLTLYVRPVPVPGETTPLPGEESAEQPAV